MFQYQPLKLRKIANEIQEKYKEEDQISLTLTKKKLPNLLAQIRRLNNDESTIIAYANTLKQIDINVLSSEYPFEKEDIETIEKIITIVLKRYNRLVGRRFWQHYQHLPFDSKIINVLKFCFKNDSQDFLALKPYIREKYNCLFVQPKPKKIIESMAIEIGNQKQKVHDTFKEWKVEQNSLLSYEIWYFILVHFINKLWFIKKQGIEFIRQKLESLTLDTYKEIIDKYLTGFNHADYHDELFTQVIRRLNDPRTNISRWNNISEQSIEKVKKRLIRDELYDFFEYDSERFNYWKRYLDHVQDVDYIVEPPIAAMYFKEFVVVEFANVGNAAYFYERNGFAENLANKLKYNVPESLLKDQNAPYYIQKLNHAGHWPQRYDEYMHYYLQGYFHYKH